LLLVDYSIAGDTVAGYLGGVLLKNQAEQKKMFVSGLISFQQSWLLRLQHAWLAVLLSNHYSMKNVDLRVVQICFKKLALNSWDCAMLECSALLL